MDERVRRARAVALRIGWSFCAVGALSALWGLGTSGVEDVGGLSESEVVAARSVSQLVSRAGIVLIGSGLGAIVGAGLRLRARYGLIACVVSAGALLCVVVTAPWEGIGGALLAGTSVLLSATGVTFGLALTSVGVLLHRRDSDGTGRAT